MNSRVALIEDRDRLRTIVGLIVLGSKPPMEDGALDVYVFVRQGDITRDYYWIFRSTRSGTGPTVEEIEDGDHTNFPWERFHGEMPPRYTGPLLWERQPDEDGRILVALGDGSVEVWDKKRLDEALGK